MCDEDKFIEKMAYEVSKNYVQPHILIRWLMLYREINKIPPFIESIKGNIANCIEIIPFTLILYEQILDEVKRTPENHKYLKDLEEIYGMLEKLTFNDLDSSDKIKQKNADENSYRYFNLLQGKAYQLFLLEKHNINKADFSVLSDENTTQLIAIFNLLNSQTRNDPL